MKSCILIAASTYLGFLPEDPCTGHKLSHSATNFIRKSRRTEVASTNNTLVGVRQKEKEQKESYYHTILKRGTRIS